MDANTMYLEHYIDLHNYISDNIYELNDDIIFTESIWKKVLIGGLAIGGIILLMKNWPKIMVFIKKILPKQIKNIFTKLDKVEKAKKEFNNNPHKNEDNDINNEFNNFIKKLSSSEVNQLYQFENIYNNIKNKNLKESYNQFIIYHTNDTSKITDDILKDINRIRENTEQKTIHEINDINDKYNIFNMLNKFTLLLKENINNYINNKEDNNFIKIINCIKYIIGNFAIYIDYLYNTIGAFIHFDLYQQLLYNNIENNYYFKTENIFSIIKDIYTVESFKENFEINIDFNNPIKLTDIINIFIKSNKFVQMRNTFNETLKNVIDNKPKFTFININVILNYQSWLIFLLNKFYKFLEKFLDLENNDI